jgi:hypothetical protein
MALLTEIFPFSMSDNERGETVVRNMTFLSAELSADGETISLKDGDAEDLFGSASELIINQEDVLVGSGNAITREQNGTTGVIHLLGAMVRLKDGKQLTSHEFTGVESVTGFWAGGNAPGAYQLKSGSNYGPMKFTGGMGQEVFLPFSGIQPGAGETIAVLAWTSYPVMDAWAYATR